MRGKIFVHLAQLLAIGIFLFAWETVSTRQAVYLSRPSQVLYALQIWLTHDNYLRYVAVTLTEAAIGLVLGCFMAIVIAAWMAASPLAGRVLAPYVTLANATPRVALAPLFLLIFGIGLWSKVLFIATAIMFFPLYAVYRALTTIEPDMIANARLLGANRAWLVLDVYIPAATGATFTSLRIAVTFALLTAVLAEFISSQSGIGYAIMEAQNALQPAFAIAGIILLGIIALVLDRGMLLAQQRLIKWQGRGEA